MASLKEIRDRLQAAEQKNTSTSGTGDSAIYPHWNIEDNTSAVLRFLPDGNEKNTFFWVERAMIRLPFNGIKGESETRNVMVQVPCMEMWQESCPVLTEVRTWFKDASLSDMGRKYWKKRSYLFQGFVRENPMTGDRIQPENPIRRFIIGPQIFTIIKSALMDPELEELPIDYQHGLDFRIQKTTKGGFADYNSSKWSRKSSALSQTELDAVNNYGLWDLSSFLPKKPTVVEVQAIKEMFEASVDGHPYDMDRWGQYFRPSGLLMQSQAAGPVFDDDEESSTSRAPARSTQPVASTRTVTRPQVDTAPQIDADDDVPFVADPPKATSSQKAEDILAMIRARQKQ
jgi:hypothetical protein